MIEVLTFQVEFNPEFPGKALRPVERGGPPRIYLQVIMEFLQEIRVLLAGKISLLQFVQGTH